MSTWQTVMNYKKVDTRHNGIANDLTSDEPETILATIDFFGGDIQQTMFDLKVARYRVFDWLAMNVMNADNPRMGSKNATKVLIYSFIKNSNLFP